MDTLLQDLHYGFRTLLRNRGFAAVAVFTLALGIGANSAIFSIIDAVLVRPLPYPNADRLVKLSEAHPHFGKTGFLVPDFVEVLNNNQNLEQVAAYKSDDFHLTGWEQPEQVIAKFISQNFFSLLGVTPKLGRTFLDQEYKPGQDRVVMISHRLWGRSFGADPNLIGQSVTLDDKSYTVVGILPQQFRLSPLVDVWVPLTLSAAALSDRGDFALDVIGRLNPEVTIEQAQSELSAITLRLGPPRFMKEGFTVRLEPLRDVLIKDARLKLLLLWGVVGFVLLISCANVANLMLARTAGRQKEFAIRTALGAGRFRVIRQLVTEAVLLACIGGAVGLLIAMWVVELLTAAIPDNLPRFNEAGINGAVIAFTFALSLLSGVAFGLAPALRFSKPDLNGALKDAEGTPGQWQFSAT